jgi:hypothetical protein
MGGMTAQDWATIGKGAGAILLVVAAIWLLTALGGTTIMGSFSVG